MVTRKDLGDVFLIYGRVLVSSCASQIQFFRQFFDEGRGIKVWKQYHVLDLRGSIHRNKGNERLTVVTDDKIFLYKIDKQTLEPVLENVLYNHF